MAIDWNSKYATDDARIDEQHQRIFRFANKLEKISQQEHVDAQEVDSLLRFLDTYIQNHFRYEEACMIKRRCPVAQKNRSQHAAFKTFFASAFETYQKEGYDREWAVSLHSKIEDWLTNHICHVDVQLKQSQEA